MKKHIQKTQSNNDELIGKGWVSLHRQILDNPISTKPDYAWLWCTLLLTANHQDKSFIWNGSKITIKKGQLITGRFELSKKTGINENKVYRILKYLESEQQIEQQKTNKYTVITIVNWERYQKSEQENEQQMNNKRTTSEQQVNTNNNYNNYNNENNITDEESSEELKEKNKQIGECIKAFEPLNPSYKILYNRKPQREAMGLLIEQYGFVEILRMIEALPELLNGKYAPVITSPYQLREKMGNLVQFIKNKKTPNGKKGGVYDARNV